jgi:predicted amidohydrolase
MANETQFKVAAVQAAPVFLNHDASVEKACNLIRKAGIEGARLVVLPEVFIPGGPYWAWVCGFREGMPFNVELYHNSVDVPGAATEALGAAAREAGAYVVIGINERDNKSIYNTLLYFDDQGRLMGKHRKFKPTGSEKLVWGEGDGSTHQVFDTAIGKLGGLICGEHTMQLPGYTLAAMGEQIHAAAWIGFGTADLSLSEICSRYYAIANNCHVVAAQSVISQDIIDRVGSPRIKLGQAWSAVIEMGSGKILAGPLAPTEEGIIYAEIELHDAAAHYFLHEATGHYRPKEFTVLFDSRPHPALIENTRAPESLDEKAPRGG